MPRIARTLAALLSLVGALSIEACAIGGAEPVEGGRSAHDALAIAHTKLAPHHLGDSPELRAWIAACPRVLKVFGPDLPVIRDYKARCDGGKVVVRVWVPASTAHYSGDGDGAADAQDFWSKGYAAVRALSAADRALVDYLESANEFDNYPPYKSPTYYDAFARRFVQLAAADGFHPLVGNIAVGNPDGDVGECDPTKAPAGSAIAKMRAMLPSIQAAGAAGGGWSYHAYTPELTRNAAAMEDWAFRYRAFVRCIPELAAVPLILTEGGLDRDGNPDTSGWQARTSGDAYLDWLRWFDGELRKDDYVVGATLFAIGGDGWKSFQLGPLVPQLVDWTNASGRGGSTPAPPPPGGGGTPVGGGAIGACWSRNGGGANAGAPFDDGGGASVHRWGPGEVQDFQGGAYGPNVCMHRDGATDAWMVRGAIRDAYFASGGGEGWLGYPLEDEHGSASGPLQRFEAGYITVDGGRFVALHGAPPSSPPPPPPPPPASACPCGSGIDNFCAWPPNTPGCPMTSPGGYCDPHGSGGYGDADWARGWNEHKAQCG